MHCTKSLLLVTIVISLWPPPTHTIISRIVHLFSYFLGLFLLLVFTFPFFNCLYSINNIKIRHMWCVVVILILPFPQKKRLKTRKTTAKKTYVQQHNNNTHTRIRTTHTTSALCSISSAAQRFVNDPSVCPSTLIFLLHFVFVLIYFSFFGVLFIFFIIFRGKKEVNWIGGTAC